MQSRCLLISLLACRSLLADYVITDNSEASLDAALAVGGRITFTQAGTISFTTAKRISRNLEIDGGEHRVIFDGGNKTRLFEITNCTVVMKNLTFANAKVVGLPGLVEWNTWKVIRHGESVFGGGFQIMSALVEFENCNFRANAAVGGEPDGVYNLTITAVANPGQGFGGAIYSTNSTIIIKKSAFNSNYVKGGSALRGDARYAIRPGGTASGGAIFCGNSALTISDSEFLDHNIRSPLDGKISGGVLSLTNGSFTIKNSRFVRNSVYVDAFVSTSDTGGGACIFYAPGSLENCYFLSNSIAGNSAFEGGNLSGGAIFSQGKIELSQCSFLSNSVSALNGGASSSIPPFAGKDGRGGGIAAFGDLAIVNTTFFRNRARAGAGAEFFGQRGAPGFAEGGALYVSGNLCTIAFSTFAENRAEAPQPEFGPHAFGGAWGGSSAAIKNSVFQENFPTNSTSPFLDQGGNFSSDNSMVLVHSSSRFPIDARLGTAVERVDHLFLPPLPDSPLINAAVASEIQVDQLGQARMNGPADSGAIEFVAPRLDLERAGASLILRLDNPLEQSVSLFSSDALPAWDLISTNPIFPVSIQAETPSRFFKAQ